MNVALTVSLDTTAGANHSLGARLLDDLTARFPSLSETTQQELQECLNVPLDGKSGVATVESWLRDNPALLTDLNNVAYAENIHWMHSISAVILAWGLGQPDGHTTNVAQWMDTWSTLRSPSKKEALPMAIDCLTMLNSVATELPPQALRDVTRYWFHRRHHQLWNHEQHWKQPDTQTALFHAIALLGSLAEKTDAHRAPGFASPLRQWLVRVRDHSLSLHPDVQQSMLTLVANSALRPSTKHRFFQACVHPCVWSRPEVKAMLTPYLACDEHARLRTDLPWLLPEVSQNKTSQRSAYRENLHREIVQHYCPELYQVLDLVTCTADWETKKTVLVLADQMQNATSMDAYSLPNGIVFEP